MALAACATLSGQECRSADWEAVGRDDGARGLPADQLERHRQACARHDIAPQEEAWRAGYAKGIEAFCTPRGGYIEGRDGGADRKQCDGRPEQAAFKAALRNGQDVNALAREIRELRGALREIEMAVLSGSYSNAETMQLQTRASQLADLLRLRELELRRLDGDYSVQHGAPPLTEIEKR